MQEILILGDMLLPIFHPLPSYQKGTGLNVTSVTVPPHAILQRFIRLLSCFTSSRHAEATCI